VGYNALEVGPMPVKIFLCYAREDETLLQKLKMHLKPLERAGFIDVWYDRDSSAGIEWEKQIKEQLSTAQIILLLVSPDFMNSDYCYSIEMRRALERHERGEARVIPVILRHTYWQDTLGSIQVLPKDGLPITDPSWHHLDRALYNVTEGIRKAIEEVTTKPSAIVLKQQPAIPKPSIIPESFSILKSNASYTGPIYLHFFNRELLRSLDVKEESVDIHNLEKNFKVLVLSNTGKLYSGISLLWENYEFLNPAFFILAKLLEYQHLELISDMPTLDEFIASRQELYKFDFKRYPMYFNEEEELSIFKPTIHKRVSTTKALASRVISWGNKEDSAIQNILDYYEVQALNIIQDFILDKTLNREGNAMTISLYEPYLDQFRSKAALKFIIGRLLSSLYLLHSRDYIDGDICTGIRGLEYYNRFSRNFPLIDMNILGFIIDRIGYREYLRKDCKEITEFLAMTRGDVEHSELTRLLHILTSGVCFSAGFEVGETYNLVFRNRVLTKLREMIGHISGKNIELSRFNSFYEIGIANLHKMINFCRRDPGFDLFMITHAYGENIVKPSTLRYR
jgi:TIR domain